MAEPLNMKHPASPKRFIPGTSVVLVISALLFGVISLGCAGAEPPPQPTKTSTEPGEGPGRRQQQLALTPAQELELGRKAYRDVLSSPQKYGRALPANSSEVQRVRKVVDRLVKAWEIEPLQREMNLVRRGFQYEWEVNVLEKNDVNAFCLPGGKIAVFTGLLRLVQNDDQLATVLGHEMGHALAHHSSERVALDEINHGRSGGFWGKKFDRAQETEADHIGIFLMTFANYNPQEALRFWERMQQAAAGREPAEINSDHPSDAHRIHDIAEWIPKAIAGKQAFDKGDIAPPRGR